MNPEKASTKKIETPKTDTIKIFNEYILSTKDKIKECEKTELQKKIFYSSQYKYYDFNKNLKAFLYETHLSIDLKTIEPCLLNLLPIALNSINLNNLRELNAETAKSFPKNIKHISLNKLSSKSINEIAQFPCELESLSINDIDYQGYYRLINRFPTLTSIKIESDSYNLINQLRKDSLNINEYSLRHIQIGNVIYNININGQIDTINDENKDILIESSEMPNWDSILREYYIVLNFSKLTPEIAMSIPPNIQDIDLPNLNSLDVETINALHGNINYLFLNKSIKLNNNVVKLLNEREIEVIQG